jgi:hypothetical protein
VPDIVACWLTLCNNKKGQFALKSAEINYRVRLDGKAKAVSTMRRNNKLVNCKTIAEADILFLYLRMATTCMYACYALSCAVAGAFLKTNPGGLDF